MCMSMVRGYVKKKTTPKYTFLISLLKGDYENKKRNNWGHELQYVKLDLLALKTNINL